MSSPKFNINDRVKISNFYLNIIGTIIGYDYDWYHDRYHYIVYLDNSFNGHKGKYILESALEKL